MLMVSEVSAMIAAPDVTRHNKQFVLQAQMLFGNGQRKPKSYCCVHRRKQIQLYKRGSEEKLSSCRGVRRQNKDRHAVFSRYINAASSRCPIQSTTTNKNKSTADCQNQSA